MLHDFSRFEIMNVKGDKRSYFRSSSVCIYKYSDQIGIQCVTTYSCRQKGLHTWMFYLWSKTTQTTGSVDAIWEDPPTCKMRTFFVMSLTLTSN